MSDFIQRAVDRALGTSSVEARQPSRYAPLTESIEDLTAPADLGGAMVPLAADEKTPRPSDPNSVLTAAAPQPLPVEPEVRHSAHRNSGGEAAVEGAPARGDVPVGVNEGLRQAAESKARVIPPWPDFAVRLTRGRTKTAEPAPPASGQSAATVTPAERNEASPQPTVARSTPAPAR